jgi:E3 ubiquitin-protein ligase UBR1
LGEELSCSDTLVQAVGFSISAVEIQQRGTEAQPGMTLLEKIPEQILTHLRILAETATSYMSVGARHSAAEGRLDAEYRKDSERQHCQLFMSRYFGTGTQHARRPLDVYPPLLSQDSFVFLVECAYGLAPAQKADIAHVLRLCYLAELVKAVYLMGRNMPVGMWAGTLANRQTQDPAMNNFADFALAITKYGMEFQATHHPGESMKDEENRGFQQPGVDTLEGWYSFTKKYALTFLRKCVVFLHVRYGVDFNSHVSLNPDAEELERLTEALRVPTFDEMCASLTVNASQCGWPATTEALVMAWVKHQVLSPRGFSEGTQPSMISHPGIFELIGLPKNFDSLIEEATRRKCPTTGKDLTDPVICLFCGAVFCSQGTCCQRPETAEREATVIGGAQQHMRRYVEVNLHQYFFTPFTMMLWRWHAGTSDEEEA